MQISIFSPKNKNTYVISQTFYNKQSTNYTEPIAGCSSSHFSSIKLLDYIWNWLQAPLLVP